MSTLVAIKRQREASREKVTQYSPGFTPIGPRYRKDRKKLSLTRGRGSTSRLEGKRKFFDKKNRAGMHPSSPEKKAAQNIQGNISYLKAKCKECEEKMSASEESYEHQDNVGDQFGGRKGKKQQKRSG